MNKLNKQNIKRLIESRMTATGLRERGGGGTEQKGKRTHGHGQQCGGCSGGGVIVGINGNRKNIIKIF